MKEVGSFGSVVLVCDVYWAMGLVYNVRDFQWRVLFWVNLQSEELEPW